MQTIKVEIDIDPDDRYCDKVANKCRFIKKTSEGYLCLVFRCLVEAKGWYVMRPQICKNAVIEHMPNTKPDDIVKREAVAVSCARKQLIAEVTDWRASGKSVDQLIFRLRTVHVDVE